MGFWGGLLDRSVVFSFDRTGYKRHEKQFDPSDLPADLSDRHLVITGANSGIGFAAARAFARRGAQLTLICRNAKRGQQAQETLCRLSERTQVALVVADLSELDAVPMIASQIAKPIHALIHNAGNMVHTLERSSDGIEIITALHVVVPYALTRALTPLLNAGAASGQARVIFVSSGGMYTQPFDRVRLVSPESPYDGTRHYAQTKRAQVVLAEALHQTLSADGISVHAMHPGWVDTPAVRRAMPTFFKMTRAILRTPEQGADTVVWLAVSSNASIDDMSGFWFDRTRVPVHLSKKTRAAAATEAELLPWLVDMTRG